MHLYLMVGLMDLLVSSAGHLEEDLAMEQEEQTC